MPPTRLIYASTRLDRTLEGLDAIFAESHRNNLRDDITGALIVSDTHFVQLLEGSRHAVSQCMGRIAKDGRHTEIEFVSTEEVAYRLFAEWSMHRIEVAEIERPILRPFLVDGAFQPMLMSQMSILNLCRVLSQWSMQRSQSAVRR